MYYEVHNKYVKKNNIKEIYIIMKYGRLKNK